jgi:hypothetical protein
LVLRARMREGWRKGRGESQPPKKRSTNKIDMKIIWAYSARKKLAKVIAEYSTLKPETNSDSPSVRSKGERLVSARAETRNIIAAGKRGMKYQTSS